MTTNCKTGDPGISSSKNFKCESMLDGSGLERLIAESRKKTRTILEQFPLAIQLVAENGSLRAVNRHWEELLGGTAEQAVGRFNLLDDRQFKEMGIADFFARVLAGATVRFPDFEYHPEQAGFNGKSCWIRVHLFEVDSGEAPDRQVAVVIQDITTCIQCEERYHVLVDNANEAIMVVQDGLVKFFNRKALDIAGYSKKEDYANKPFVDFVHPDHRQMILERHRRRTRGETVPSFYQIRIMHKDGGSKWLQLNAVKIDWEGRPASLAFLYDITEHKKIEEELALHRNNLEAMVRQRTHALEQALDEVRTLKGLIPVCVSCKNIRDDKGYWNLMEEYISTHSNADCTHGLCPDCAVKLYPDLFTSDSDLEEYTRASIEAAKKADEKEG